MRDNRYSLLIWLLLGALVLSTGLNCYLVLPRETNQLPAWLAADDDDEDASELTTAVAELQMTRAMLARCQAAHLQKDSLLVSQAAANHLRSDR